MKSIVVTFLLVLPCLIFGQNLQQEWLKYIGQSKPGLTPIKFASDLVSLNNQYEFGSVFSSNGEEFYYAADMAGKAEIRYMKLNKGQWTKPVVLLSDKVFSYNDPMLSPDESKLFFISDRPLGKSGEKKDYDIWYIEKKGSGWSDPVNAGPVINSDKNEYYISFSNKGTMYFSSNRKGKDERADNYNIYAAKVKGREFTQPASPGDSINTQHYEADVFVASDESYLIFSASRPDGYGAGDLYISFKKADGTWTKAKNMGDTINTPGHELCPFVSKDGKYFFYTSCQDIYWVDARILDKLR
ncbi:hypothetical protein QNI16_11575 [Cytophagaceae bacterium YF14B1]|uniref:WD40-like Beta Propeller Repeat n=1 Tax=Xanthocytophaga flava TaxID=3048013 RepID=A0AAE3U695_9BACT|nr:hypothetical protein [Xanthocytophaga flavus]MDJ1481126.1 hypothetical protein [Xanthocytophaga flavus]